MPAAQWHERKARAEAKGGDRRLIRVVGMHLLNLRELFLLEQ